MAQKVYKITFKTRKAVGLFLYELRMWGIRDTRYGINELTVTTKDAAVVDVCTESLEASQYTIKSSLV